LRVDFVGHPLVAQAAAARAEPLAQLPWQGEPRIALLPGSRYHEVKRILPVMWATTVRVQRQFPDAEFIIAAPSEEVAGWVHAVMSRLSRGPRRVSVVVRADAAGLAPGARGFGGRPAPPRLKRH